MDKFLAGSQVEDPTLPIQLFAGDTPPVTTEPGVLVSGQNLLAFTVLGRVAASGKYTQHAPGGSGGAEKACAILMHTTDASGGDKGVVVYTAGMFNTNALVWAGGITAVQKAIAFDDSKISHRALGYSG